MVIFHSYVSLPEGSQTPNSASKTIPNVIYPYELLSFPKIEDWTPNTRRHPPWEPTWLDHWPTKPHHTSTWTILNPPSTHGNCVLSRNSSVSSVFLMVVYCFLVVGLGRLDLWGEALHNSPRSSASVLRPSSWIRQRKNYGSCSVVPWFINGNSYLGQS